MLRAIDKVRDGYAAVVRRLVRFSVISLVLTAAIGFGIFTLGSRTPQGFLPQEDQGAFFVQLQLPQGASVGRTREAATQVEAILRQNPAIANILAIIGFSLIDQGAQSNSAFIVARMKPFADRTEVQDSVNAAIGRVFGGAQAIRGVAGYTAVGMGRDARMVENLRDRGVILRAEDLGIDKRLATRDLLAAKNMKDLVRASGGLYDPPKRFRNW